MPELLPYMPGERQIKYRQHMRKLRAMPFAKIAGRIIATRVCPYRPELLKGYPLGMHHCPACGMMVVAGIEHGPVQWRGSIHDGYGDFTDEQMDAWSELQTKSSLDGSSEDLSDPFPS
jgi:hypothetical protein